MSYIAFDVPTYLATAVCIVALFVIFKSKLSRHPYPPGPKGLPLIGNIRDLPSSCEWITYAKWSRQFASGVIHLNLLGTHLLIVNSLDAAVELFDRRSAIYSCRPRLPMLVELSGWDWTLAFFTYGNKWRFYRRLFYQHFNTNAVANFEPQETKAAHDLLYRLVQEPEKFMEYTKLMAGSLILSVAYGLDVQTIDHPLLLMVEQTMDTLRIGGNPGSFLVDTLPLLKYVPEWVPGAGFKRTAREWRRIVQATADVPMQQVRDQMAKGTSVPSIASLSLEELEGKEDREMEERIRGVCAGIYAAGSDTTVSTLHSFFLVMVLYPDVAKKAQEELDRVVGYDRLPDFTDKPSLPYINALVKELLRWNPVTPLAVPHRLMVDDVYDGKFMPAGSLILGNAWAMLHDESVYPEPDVFNPERFLKDGKLDPDVRPPEAFAFGFGRRLCPGREFALSSIFIAVASVLSAFDIGKAVGEDGSPITPSGEFVTGLLCTPKPFKCSIKARSQQALNLVDDAYAMHHPDARSDSVVS